MARGRFTFWLDYNKDDEILLAETIDELKRKRRFVTTIRDGLRLICDLRQGKVDVLFELFPWVKSEWMAGLQAQETAGERALREQLERIEQQLLKQGNKPIPLPPIPMPERSASSGGIKSMNVPTFAAPDFDDDDDDDFPIITPSKPSLQGSQNFLQSVLNLTKGN